MTENRVCSKTMKPREMDIHKKNIAEITSLAASWTLSENARLRLKREKSNRDDETKKEEKNTESYSPEL